MKITRNLALSFLLLVVIASLYRIMPGRPYGFAPQIAMAIFGGAIIKDKKWAFLLPLLSMFVSDALYQALYMTGASPIYGFYEGQVLNYVLFGSMVVFGFFIKNFKIKSIALSSVLAPTTYFILSNSAVWLSPGAGLGRPTTFSGWLMTLADGLPFYAWSLAGTFVFSAVFFGFYYFIQNRQLAPAVQK